MSPVPELTKLWKATHHHEAVPLLVAPESGGKKSDVQPRSADLLCSSLVFVHYNT